MKGETLNKTSVSDHTKGEWYVNDSNLEGAGLLFVDVDNVDGEETYSTAICEVKLTHPTDTALADARLIAAAPDMLEALVELVQYLEWREDFTIEDAAEGETNCYTRAQAVIKKAQNGEAL